MSNKEPQYSTVLVDLDCLLDTRFGTLYCLDRDVAARALQTYYIDRERDEFEHIDAKTFRSFYDKRNKSVLQYSPVTEMVDFLQEFVVNTHKNTINSPFEMIPKIVINTYPYDLTQEEFDTLAKTFVYLTAEECDIEVVHTNPVEFTPAYVKKHFSILIMYDYTQWLEEHSRTEAFKTTTCPEVSLLVPSIYFAEPQQKHIDDLKKSNLTLFSGLELMAESIINLRVLKTAVFSSAINPQTTEDLMDVEKIAKACHEANRIYSLSLGDTSSLHWDEIPQEQRDTTIGGVNYYLSNPAMTAEDAHQAWVDSHLEQGWTYGEEKDVEKKTHPCLVSFEDLPAPERYKDLMFKAVIDALADEPAPPEPVSEQPPLDTEPVNPEVE